MFLLYEYLLVFTNCGILSYCKHIWRLGDRVLSVEFGLLICSPGFLQDRCRSHPITSLNNQILNAHSLASGSSPVQPLDQRTTETLNAQNLFSPKRSQELITPARLLGSAPLPSPRSWRAYPGGGGPSSSARPGGALARAVLRLQRPAAGPNSSRADCRRGASPFCIGAHPRNSAGKSCFPHPTLLPVKS